MAKKIEDIIPEELMKHITLAGVTWFWTESDEGNILRKIRLPYAESTVDVNIPKFLIIEDEEELETTNE